VLGATCQRWPAGEGSRRLGWAAPEWPAGAARERTFPTPSAPLREYTAPTRYAPNHDPSRFYHYVKSGAVPAGQYYPCREARELMELCEIRTVSVSRMRMSF